MGRPTDVDETFAQLYDWYYKAIYHTAYGILHSAEEAEDVMQETFHSLLNSLQRGETINNPGGWLLQVARNGSYNATRRMNRLADAEELEKLTSSDRADSSENTLFVHQMLSTLSDAEREIVTLHVIAGLKLSEIALLMELPSATVRWRFANAKKQLRRALREVP